MVEENISQECRLKNIGETRNYVLEETEQNELMNRKHKKVLKTLNYIEYFLILASTITGYISISAFASLLGIKKIINRIKIFSVAGGIEKFMSIIKKKKNKHDKIILLSKTKLKT